MEPVSLVISIVALLGSLFSYLIHERKLKAQEAKINAYQLKKIEKEEAEAKKAIVRATLIKGEKGKRILKVFNKGGAVAKNVRFSIEEEDADFFISKNPFPFRFLGQQESVEMIFHLTKGAPDEITIGLTWDDDYQQNNTHQQIISF